MLDATNQQIRFRNPVNQAQADSLQAILIAEQNCGKTKISQRFDPNKKMRDRFLEKMEASYQNTLASEDRWKAELVDVYMKGKHGSGPPAIGCGTDMASESAAIKGLLANRSTMAMKQTPAPGNGQTLLIAPYDPVLAGPATVVDAGGREIWRGQVSTETAVDMSGQPSGLYFLKGAAGLSLSFNVVR